ncbi:unnamed protein product [Darwinula stevensoni]|uniref:IRS-type PTB domain-containing protein n=1 Tax=Darwinula stevensoni TaxID=69355 RepID=A0A7R9A939_9CRUS|nr:unnamed protein product [Darwinula stevensoni]CAG0897031.1 unnamed protein product [Darwinula stevensoni]
MGCISSCYRRRAPNVFPVMNVDEEGNRMTPGKLEVTPIDLILHQTGKPSIIWPLKSLRRYGFDPELKLFSFESGRRCFTGPGIFAFKCEAAESLFNLLQLHVQQQSGVVLAHQPNNGPRLGSETGYTETNGNQHSSTRERNRDDYENPMLLDNPAAPYVNARIGMQMQSPSYINVIVNSENAETRQSVTSNDSDPGLGGMNYVELDLERTSPENPSLLRDNVNGNVPAGGHSTESSQASNVFDSPNRGDRYATIDFDKTAALSLSNCGIESEDTSTRRTRHDSIIPTIRE